MFRTDRVRWEGKVHERPICEMPKERLKGYIEHYTYENWQDWWDKAGHYTSIWAEDAYKRNKKASLGSAFFHAAYGFLGRISLKLVSLMAGAGCIRVYSILFIR